MTALSLCCLFSSQAFFRLDHEGFMRCLCLLICIWVVMLYDYSESARVRHGSSLTTHGCHTSVGILQRTMVVLLLKVHAVLQCAVASSCLKKHAHRIESMLCAPKTNEYNDTLHIIPRILV